MPLAPLQFRLVNVFTSVPHAGSQAAVILLPPNDPRGEDSQWQSSVSSDFNLPATVFLQPLGQGSEPNYRIRWYTGVDELPLCGHGTLAASWVVFNELDVGATRVVFENPKAGQLSAVLEGGRGQGCKIGFSLPISVTSVDEAAQTALSAPIVSATGLSPSDILSVATYVWNAQSSVIQVKDSVDLQHLKVDPRALGEHNTVTIITQLAGAAGDGGVKVNSRVFIPSIGLDEDTATGSAHSVLTGYYLSPSGGGAASVAALLDREDVVGVSLHARQLSPRGGGMQCAYKDGRAWLVGQAWRTGQGSLDVFEEGGE